MFHGVPGTDYSSQVIFIDRHRVLLYHDDGLTLTSKVGSAGARVIAYPRHDIHANFHESRPIISKFTRHDFIL